jgi:hypothetical protein
MLSRLIFFWRRIVIPRSISPRNRIFEEFRCRECGGREAYRSRPRNFFEKQVLPLLMLQPVRCNYCYDRRYVLRSIPAPTRVSSEQ